MRAAAGGCGGRLGGRRRRRSQEQAERRRRRRRDRPAEEGGHDLQGPLPVPRREDAVVHVTPARETWKCFGCGLGGDIFNFVMQRDGCPSPRRSRSWPRRPASSSTSGRAARTRGRRACATSWRRDRLLPRGPDRSPQGQPALDYLRGRGFTDETIETFQLGWAPGGWDTASQAAHRAKRRSTADELVEVGLAHAARTGARRRLRPVPRADHLPDPGRERDRGRARRPRPRRRGRHPRPRPEVPELAGDAAVRQEPDAVPDRPGQGPIRKAGQAVIVEGYTDALMAHQAGFDNVVASLGTALTPGPGRAAHPLREEDRPRLRRRPAGQKAGTFGVTELEALIAELARPTAGVELTRSASSGCRTARTPTRSSARRRTGGARRSGRRTRSSTT